MVRDESLRTADTAQLRALLARGELSARELARATLDRIDEADRVLNCFTTVFADEALEAAQAADAVRGRGERTGPLHGIPVAIKDLTPVAGHPTTRGSRVFAHDVTRSDAVAVGRLRRAGAVIVGKTATPEFAHSGFTDSPLHGITRNPWNPARTPGGSSGGSAAAVASGCVALAEGSDMGGSIRAPAAFCGVYGLKPSLGRVPLDFLPTVFESIAHTGPLGRSAADLAAFLDVCAGPHDADIQSLPREPGTSYSAEPDIAGLRIALSPDLGYYDIDTDVARNLDGAAAALRDAGASVTPVDLGWSADINRAWYTYWQVYMEALYGEYRADWHHEMTPGLVQMMAAAQRVSAVELKRIDRLRTQQWRALARVLADHDALICPTTARTAPAVDAGEPAEPEIDPDGTCRESHLTHPFNFVAQCPVASAPSGVDGAGLPTAVQIVGRRFDDATVLRVCAALERAELMRGHTPPPLQPVREP